MSRENGNTIFKKVIFGKSMSGTRHFPGKVEIQPIGRISSCYMEKFGIPRQPGLVTKAVAIIELLSPFDRIEMYKELEQFSHIWVIFQFNEVLHEGWKNTVRPPGLGGQQRVGVFASRSPHRPNHLGISVVKLNSIKQGEGAILVEVEGGDFLNGTPVFDIKPYVPFADRIEEAYGGYSAKGLDAVEVCFTHSATSFCQEYCRRTGRDLAGIIEQVLHQDPRPANQRQRKLTYGMQLWDVNIRWKVQKNSFEVIECSMCQESS